MTIQYRSASTLAYVTGSAETITKPTGTIDGDYMFLMVCDNSAVHRRLVPPTDWLDVPLANLTGENSIYLWYKEAASEPADYTVTGGGSELGVLGIITVYSDTGADITVEDVTSQGNAASTTRTWPSVTFSVAGLMACFGCFSTNNAATAGGSMTERFDDGQTGIRGY